MTAADAASPSALLTFIARVVEIVGARHRIVSSNEADALRELRPFLAAHAP
jgi:hypothetical protein